MAGRILIVDSVSTNRIVLRVKLATAYYDVIQAEDGAGGLASLGKAPPDLVIVAGTLPDMSAHAFCAALRAAPGGDLVPVVVMLDGDDPGDRLAALAAGADDVLERPLDDLVLLARLRSLIRARDAEAELAMRDDTRRTLGLAEAQAGYAVQPRVLLVAAEGAHRAEALRARLPDSRGLRLECVAPEDMLREGRPAADVIVLLEAPARSAGSALALLPQLRASFPTRHASIIYVAERGQASQAAAALDMGASDLLATGPDPEELLLRITKQARRKQLADRLRANMRDSLKAAVIDPLTGLHNRRYAMPHLERLAEQSILRKRPMAVLLADLDHFKKVNDTLGHAAGDEVLIRTGDRLRKAMRDCDLVARFGGEEFLIVMPDTNAANASVAAAELVAIMRARPITLSDGTTARVTLSLGYAVLDGGCPARPRQLLERADRALYAAKEAGRDRALADAPVPGEDGGGLADLRCHDSGGPISRGHQPRV